MMILLFLISGAFAGALFLVLLKLDLYCFFP